MFFLDSTSEGTQAMHWKLVMMGAVAVGSTLASPARAQQETDAHATHTAPAMPQDGYRLARSADGFALVEHGVWRRPQANEAHVAGTPAGSNSAGPSAFRRARYLYHVRAAEARYALPTGLLDALVWTESRYDPLAVSKAGAAGLGQLMPGTARELGVANRFDPMANLIGAAKYLRQMLDRFGVVHLALAAYNAGPGAVERAGGIPRNGETPAYVRDVLRHWRF